MLMIRPIQEDEWPAVWTMIEPVLRAGETYAYASTLSADEAYRVWIEAPLATYVAYDASQQLVGTYYIKANQPGQGAHVCNCGYIVAPTAREQGVGAAMCRHSQQAAVKQGFRAMQYNLVVATNESAVRLWQANGFEICGRLPEAFRHPRLGYVDALVMYKRLA